MRHLQLVELAPHMRPAGRFLNLATVIKMMEAGVGIGLQDSLKAAQMFSRMLTPAIRRVGEPHRCRCAVTRRTIIPHVRPQATGLGLAVARSQHRNRRVISVQLASTHDMAAEGFYKWLQQATTAPHPPPT